jgi:hypothetical protein
MPGRAATQLHAAVGRGTPDHPTRSESRTAPEKPSDAQPLREPSTPSPARVCGPCRACCKAPPIPELDKPADTWCRHIVLDRSDKGCGNFENRPAGCAAFRCAWLDGLGTDADRPDRLGVLFHAIATQDGREALAAVEYRPGALADARPREIIELLARHNPGRVYTRRAHTQGFARVELTIARAPIGAPTSIIEPKPLEPVAATGNPRTR